MRTVILPLVVIVALCGVAFVLPLIFAGQYDLTLVFLLRQDRWLLLAEVVILALACLGLRYAPREITAPAWTPFAVALFVVCICAVGHKLVLCGYDMSRDEQMAVFDARIFSSGRIVAPLPAIWQAHAEALNLLFMLPVSHPIAWVSGYLPMNAMLRTLVGVVADPALTSPLLTGLGLVFLWLCARRMWPQEREAGLVAMLLYVASGQILLAGMTAYAMPAHLTLDLLWLWLFLRGRTMADLGALTVAAVATGLHQPLFHPLFALPFLVGLVGDRAWTRAAVYLAGYAAICSFWLAWPLEIHTLITGPTSLTKAAGTDYFSRLLATLATGNPARIADMVANLLRFAAWQPIMLLPLMAAGIVLGRREQPTVAMAASVILPIIVMAIILPYQGHGFGYRYLHGVLGPGILLAVQGYRHLVRRDPRLRALLVRTAVAGLLVVLPMQAYAAHAFYAPYAAVDGRIRKSGADVVIIGHEDASFARDLVLNRADLGNRPLRLLADLFDDDLIATVCRDKPHVAMPTDALFAPIDAYYGVAANGAADARFTRLSPKLVAAGCSVERLGP